MITLVPGTATLATLEEIWRGGEAVRLDPACRAGVEAAAERVQAAAQGPGAVGQRGQVLGTVKVEKFTGAGCGVLIVGEADELSRGFKEKTQGRVVCAPFEVGRGVALGLGFVSRDIFAGAVPLGLDDAHGIAFDEQDVVRRSRVRRILAYGNTDPGSEIELLHILHDPAGLFQLLVNNLSSLRFWCHGEPRSKGMGASAVTRQCVGERVCSVRVPCAGREFKRTSCHTAWAQRMGEILSALCGLLHDRVGAKYRGAKS